MVSVARDKAADFMRWVTQGRVGSRPPILEILKSDEATRSAPSIHWSKLQLLIIDWADQQCSVGLRSGSADCFADIDKLYAKFLVHWEQHKLAFLALYPEAQEWDINQLNYLPKCLFEILLDDLAGSGNPLEAKMVRPYDRQRIRSNAYELAYYLLNLRQRMVARAAIIKQPRLTHMLKVHAKERRRPKRNVGFYDEIRGYLLGIRFRELASPEWEVIQKDRGRDWLLEVWGMFLDRIHITEIAPFQLKCFKTILDSALFTDSRQDPIMITAGTGFGKTEGFLFPILFYATINLLRHNSRVFGPDAILVYPRIDLCNNQLERYLWYAHCLKASVNAAQRTASVLEYEPPEMFRASLGHSGARSDDAAEPFQVECPECKAEGQIGFIRLRKEGVGNHNKMVPYCSENPAHQAERFLIPQLTSFYPGRFTVAISTADTLHRRLMDLHGRATLWRNSEFLPRFIVLDEIHIYDGQAGSHVANLTRRLRTYLKNINRLPSEERVPNPRPPIFIGASATIGNPQSVGSAIFGVPRANMENRILKPDEAESEPLGREYTYLLKTPPIREVQDDVNGRNRVRVVSEQASLLQALMAFWHAMRKTVAGGVGPGKYRLLTFVDSIDSVWRITKNLDDAESRKRLFQFRVPRGRWGRNITIEGNNSCPRFVCGAVCEAPPHQFFEQCGIYRQGECWWSMGTSPEDFLRPMAITGRMSRFTKTAPNFPREQSIDKWDCMVATSTLEVGFDHSELIATAQFKAPPNPASFQQRKGRGGRSVEDIPITLMILGNSPGDLFAFKHEQRYFEPSAEDLKIQFDDKNKFIRNQHALSAVYDFMGWQGITKASPGIYRECDIRSALDSLKKYRRELNNWMIDLYGGDGLNRDECSRLADQCLDQMSQSVVTLNRDFHGIYNSLDLFRIERIPPEWLFLLRQKINQGHGDSVDRNTLVVLEAAARREDDYLQPPDYFNLLPIDNSGSSRDPSWVIPGSFIPTPIGGTIAVEGPKGPGGIVTEPKLQTLANFLPGGYKHRWNFKLWYGEWKGVSGQPGCADVTDLSRDAEDLGTLDDVLVGRPLPPPLACFNPQATRLVNPRVIRVQSGQEKFSLTPDKTRVKNANDGPGGVALSREPSSAAQTYDLILRKDGGASQIALEGEVLGARYAQFGEMELLRLFYNNLVNCYPTDQGQMSQPPHSIILKFYDRGHGKYVIPTVKLHTQGISLEGSVTEVDLLKSIDLCKQRGTYEAHFWRSVYRLLWREAFLNRSVSGFEITFSFDCIRWLKALMFLDYQARLANKPGLEILSEDQAKELFGESKRVCDELHFDLFDDAERITSISGRWAMVRDRIINRARREVQKEIAESIVQSLTAAVCRDIAEKTNTNLDLIENSVEVYQSRQGAAFEFRSCVYDNIQGGNGTTATYVDRIGHSMDLRAIFNKQRVCDTDKSDRSILALLQDQAFDADMLYSLIRAEHELQRRGFSEQAIFKLSRLVSSPPIAAFYQGAADNYQVLSDLLGREPGEEEFACYLKERPIGDPRGNQLFEKFSTLSGGVSEIIPRIAEIMPLCHGSCPDCLGDSRLSFEKGETLIADRNLLPEA